MLFRSHEKALESSFPRQVGELTSEGGVTRFLVQDGDSNWWEVTSLPATYYQSFFDRGDVE